MPATSIIQFKHLISEIFYYFFRPNVFSLLRASKTADSIYIRQKPPRDMEAVWQPQDLLHSFGSLKRRKVQKFVYVRIKQVYQSARWYVWFGLHNPYALLISSFLYARLKNGRIMLYLSVVHLSICLSKQMGIDCVDIVAYLSFTSLVFKKVPNKLAALVGYFWSLVGYLNRKFTV